MNYSEISKELTQLLSKENKRKNGIYFSPPNAVRWIVNFIENILPIKGLNILEPSCGSCEFINQLNGKENEIMGIENSIIIYEKIKKAPDVKIVNEDFLQFNTEEKFDLIIGNPPYYVLKKDNNCDYKELYEGRPNIFILFILKSLKLLKEGGILAFILPKSFLNCIYYRRTREYIIKNFEILAIEERPNDTYLETKQETIILIIRNTPANENEKYVWKNTLASPDKIQRYNELTANSETLDSLNFRAKIGTIVWNQHKDKLTNDEDKTLLIYSSCVSNNQLIIKEYFNSEKKKYIDLPGWNKPILIINRGYGNGKYKFNYCLVDINHKYLVENHLIYIEFKNNLPHNELLEQYQKIIDSFNDERTQEFVKLYFGNNAINLEELTNILPIYIN